MRPYELFAHWSDWGWPLLANHLWQATLFALFALAAATLLGRAPANARYFIWLVALVKFALPSALLAFVVSQAGLELTAPAGSNHASSARALAVAPLFSPVSHSVRPAAGPATRPESAAVIFTAGREEFSHLYTALTCIWVTGSALLLISWSRRRRRLRRTLAGEVWAGGGRESEALRRVQSWLGHRREVRLVTTPAVSEPGVWGVWRPVILLPEGLADRLDDDELEAVLLHEMSHVERWDNLAGNVQRALCCLFWFHPLIWLIDRRLIEEREQACDDAVVRLSGAAAVYANTITKVCRYCLGWEVAGLSRASGSDTKKRIYRIISDCAGGKLSAFHIATVMFTAAGALAFSAAAGVVEDGRLGVQSGSRKVAPAETRFEKNGLTKVHDTPAGWKNGGGDNPGHPTRGTAPVSAAQSDAATNSPVRVRAGSVPVDGAPPASNAVVIPRANLSPPEGPPPAPAPVTRAIILRASDVDYADLKKFVGRYEVDPAEAENFVLDITLERGLLWLKPSHAPKRRLIRQSYTDFSDAGSQFRFTSLLDESDRVVGLRLDSRGGNVTARKLSLPPPHLKGNVTFRLRGYPEAKVVAVAGTFNQWNQSQFLFARDGDEWVCRLNLAPGTYEYKFIVDGDWLADPNNRKTVHDERGHVNSLLTAE